MYITTEKGIFIIYGEVIHSQFKKIDKGTITVRTKTPFKDQRGIVRTGPYNWFINIINSQTTIIDPSQVIYLGPLPTHAIVEATPYDDYDNFWYHPNGKEKTTLRLKALFTSELEEYRAHFTPTGLLDAVEYEPKGSSYMIWWRPDEIEDNNSLVTGIYDPYESGEYGDFMKGGYQDPERGDMEFFYEDERWSRDP